MKFLIPYLKSHSATSYWFVALTLLLIASPATVGAAEGYVPLVGIPGLSNDAGGRTLVDFINAAYILLIAVGSLVAVVKIAMAGFKYAISDIVTQKSAAKSDIVSSLLGLAILLIPYIVLNTIYPNLTSLDILQNSDNANVQIDKSGPVSSPGGTNSSGSSGASNNSSGSGSGSSVNPGGSGSGAASGGYEVRTDRCTYSESCPENMRTVEGMCTPGAEVYDDKICRSMCTQKGGSFRQVDQNNSACDYSVFVPGDPGGA